MAWIIRVICGVKLLPGHILPTARAIYFANHSSHLDFATIWAALPKAVRNRARPVAGRDYWEKSPFRRWVACEFFNSVLIERKHVTAENNPLTPMLAALEAGDSLIVFPEGTRSLDGQIHEFKPGLYHLARARPETVLVPLYLQNLSRILPKGDFFPVPLIGSLSLGAPLKLEPEETKVAFLQKARSAIQHLAKN